MKKNWSTTAAVAADPSAAREEIVSLRATNAELLAALKSLLAYDADGADQPLPGTREAEVIAAARAASAKAEGQS